MFFSAVVSKQKNKKNNYDKKQSLLKGKISLEILKMLSVRPFLSSKIFGIVSDLKDISDDIQLIETDDGYKIFLKGMDIMHIYMNYVNESLRKLKIIYFTDLVDIKNQVWDFKIKEVSKLEFLFLKPCNTVMKEYSFYACDLSEPRSYFTSLKVKRYEGEELRTEECCLKGNRVKRSYYLPNEACSEYITCNGKKNTLNLSGNQFDKKYMNALSLTKEKR